MRKHIAMLIRLAGRKSSNARRDPMVPASMRANSWLKRIAKIGWFLMMGVSMSADAGLFGFGGTSWKEEALLHDGSKLIVERSVERGGRHEIGQAPPYKAQSLAFTMPGTNQQATWEDKFSEDIGTASFLPMLIDVVKDTAYLVASPMGCLSYNKWGRPNPPYVIFKYQGKAWQRINLQELPAEIKMPNLIHSSPDTEVKKSGKHLISAEMITAITSDYRQPEFKIILRVPVKHEGPEGCPEMIFYKGAWVGPGDSIGKRMMDSKSK